MKRQRIQKRDADEVMGEGSWVEFALLTWGQMREADLDRKAGGEPYVRVIGQLRSNVLAWNWQGDDDNPLPQPQEDPAVFDTLTDPEIGFLVKCIRGLLEAKNS